MRIDPLGKLAGSNPIVPLRSNKDIMYNAIYDLCKIRNKGSVLQNGAEGYTPRVKWIVGYLAVEFPHLKFKVDRFKVRDGVIGYNIILPGESGRWVTCHHDIVNPDSDNAQDNSCSIINAIALKNLAPQVNVAILDGEEFGGLGAQDLSLKLQSGEYEEVEWILNLELTGLGGMDFLICDSIPDGALSGRVRSLFECDIESVPFNDSVIFREDGFDSIVINPLPRLESGRLDTSILRLCHSVHDKVEKISIEDMKIFTEKVLLPIVS